MLIKQVVVNWLLPVVVLVFGVVGSAWAYLDPGTGSLILQAIIGTVAAVVATAGVYWHKFRSFFSKNKSSDENNNKEE